MAEVKLIRHKESYEVRLADGTSKYWYYDDDDPIRRTLMHRTTSKQAIQDAKTYAGEQQPEIEKTAQSHKN